MKNFKRVLFFLLVVVMSVGSISGQTPAIQTQSVFTDFNFIPPTGTSHRTKWEVVDNSNTNLRNEQVATLRGPNSSSSEPFDTRIRGFSTAVIRFNTCKAVGKTFTVFWNTYNWVGTNVGNGTFTAVVLPPPVGQLTPTFAFSSINGSCNQVTLCVTNPLPGATYAWNGTKAGVCVDFDAPAPAQIQAVATCGIGPGSVVPSTQMPPGPPFPPGVSFNEGTNATVCEGQQLSLNATSKTCINSPSNWFWSSSGGSISNESVSSGSTADAVFTASSSGSYVVTIQVTDIFGNVSTDNINIQVLSQSDPQCNIFFLKQSTDKPQVSADKAKKMEDINSNTDGSNGSTKIDVDNKSGIKKGIYPNPANEVLNVGNIQGVQSIEVVDLNGKVIKTVSVGENEISRALNVSDLSGGIYILKKIKRDGQLEATKFQVIH
jgi:Secretion system C-terminal sorting domain